MSKFKTKWSSSHRHVGGLLTYALGFSNSRLVFLVFHYHKSNFTIPYLLVQILICCPVTIVELSMSQFSGKDFVSVWDAMPVMRGIGYCSIMILVMRQVEDSVMLGISTQYALSAALSQDVWKHCNNSWNTISCYTPETYNDEMLACMAVYQYGCANFTWDDSFVQFFENSLFKKRSNRGKGHIRPNLKLCLLIGLNQMLLFFILRKGNTYIETMGPIILVISNGIFATLAYFMMITTGGKEGVAKLFSLDFRRLTKTDMLPKVTDLTIGGMGFGIGGFALLSSQGDFRDNSYKRAVGINLLVLLTNVLMIIFILAAYGVIYERHPFGDEVQIETKYAWFTEVAKAMYYIEPENQIWVVLCYIGVYLLSFNSMCINGYILLSTIFNHIRHVDKVSINGWVSIYCVFIFMWAVPFTSDEFKIFRTTLFYLTIFGGGLTFLVFAEMATWVYFYGLSTFSDDLHFMLGFKLFWFWRFAIFLTPLMLMAMYLSQINWGYALVQRSIYPQLYQRLLFCVFPVFVVFVVALYYLTFRLKLNVKRLFRSSYKWNLKDGTLRQSRQMFSSQTMTKESIYRQERKNASDAKNKEKEDAFDDGEFIA